MPYDVYDSDGRKIGEIRSTSDDGATIAALLALAILAIGIVVVAVPYWTAYAMGKGTWSYRSRLTRLSSAFLLGVWVIGGLSAIYSVITATRSEYFNKPAHVIMILVFVYGGLGLAYYIGKALRKK
ncbi:MAG: hypothetical protein RML95_09750 [Anaerolineae bacterium]|nr:hypothetical protein [Anaerolineae bacterium]MDW8299608.1 hypothetical protein [Anaerolineae bacterium]